MKSFAAGVSGIVACALLTGCGGGGGGTVTQVPTITKVSVSLASSSITGGKTDQATATVSGTGNYSSAVTWSVSPSSAGTINSSGLFTASSSTTGTATITATSTQDATKSGTANVKVTAVTVTVSPSTAVVGAATQFTATASDGSTPTWMWTVADSTGGTTDAGTISSAGVFQSPYPLPAGGTVTVTATSSADSTVSGNVTVTLSAPATATGPSLTVDAGNQMHAISPYIYGANGWQLDKPSAAIANFSILRWGGDATSRYNYQLNSTNSASDWYFENFTGQNGAFPSPGTTAAFTDFVKATDAAGMTALGTVPLQGWVSNSNTNNNSGTAPACSFPQSSYPNQQSYNGTCGNGICMAGQTCGYLTCPSSATNGCSLYGAATTPAITSVQEPPPSCAITQKTTCANGVANCMVQTCTEAALPTPSQLTGSWAQSTWSGGWANSFVTNASYGNGASGKGVAIWDLDNEPAWWDAVHRDVHPDPSTYDEVTLGGVGTALAIKTADPTALVSGPIIDFWWNYFYSKQDIEAGWGTGPCYQPWAAPNDRVVHNGVAMIPYYLDQMQQSERSYGFRLLDYLDIHGYFAGSYNGNSVAFTTAGDTGEQKVRMDSVRALWDPTYTNANYPQPNYQPADPTNCSVPMQAPEAVPMLEQWVNGVGPRGDANYNYPGTKTAIDEYNFGALESINGAVTQADVLGVFGQYGLDMATLWPTSQYTQQGPGNYAFAMYRNYDGKDSTFGDMALASCSTTAALSAQCTPADASFQPVANMETGQGQLSVYGALRTKDNAVTVMVINKSYGPLTSTISLLSVPTPGSVTAYQYSNANLTGISQVTTGITVTPATAPSTTSTISYTFPAQSITLFVIPQ